MPKGQHLSAYQQGIVKRYYEHKDGLMVQKLQEHVSELYLADSPKKTEKLWKSVETALGNLKATNTDVAKVLATKDVKALAELVQKLGR